MFQPRFAELVERGEKLQTVRPTPKRMPEAGDRISLRTWTGKPYRSKQRILGEGMIVLVATCSIGSNMIICSRIVDPVEFARADGFATWLDMREWFKDRYGLPFTGILIRWRKI